MQQKRISKIIMITKFSELYRLFLYELTLTVQKLFAMIKTLKEEGRNVHMILELLIFVEMENILIIYLKISSIKEDL